MNIRTIPVSAPYNPVAFHILQRDDFTEAEIKEHHKIKQDQHKHNNVHLTLTNEELKEYYDNLRDNYIRIYHMRDIASKAYIIGGDPCGTVPVVNIKPEALSIPTVTMASYPLLTKKESRELYKHFKSKELAHKHILERSKDALMRQIDTLVLNVVNAAVEADHSITVIDKLEPENINFALSLIDQHGLPRGAILMSPCLWSHVESWDHEELIKTNYDVENHEVGVAPIWAYYKNIPILVCTICPKNAVYILSKKEYIGVINVLQDIKVYENKYIEGKRPIELIDTLAYANETGFYPIFNSEKNININEIEASWTVLADMGVGIMNDYGIVKILVHTENKCLNLKTLKKDYQKLLIEKEKIEHELKRQKQRNDAINITLRQERDKNKSLGSCADQSIYKQETPLPLN